MEFSQEESEVCTQDEEKCINEMVKAILILDHSKKPFKQADISKYLSIKPSRKSWDPILNQTKERLNELGLKLVDVHSSNSKSYILTSCFNPISCVHEVTPESELADRTLLFLVLTYIFMKEEQVTSTDIFNHLQQLQIYDENQSVHSYFGDIKKKILTEFVSQLYLEKITDKESGIIEIKWGERAHAEVSKRSVLEFVCKVGYDGSIQPKNLVSHYHKVLEEEGLMNEEENTPMEVS